MRTLLEIPSTTWMLRDNRQWRLNREILLRIRLCKSLGTAKIHAAKTSKLEPIQFPEDPLEASTPTIPQRARS
jgi:hypothetical protein